MSGCDACYLLLSKINFGTRIKGKIQVLEQRNVQRDIDGKIQVELRANH